METHVIRLTPGQDLFLSLEVFIKNKNIKAACILTCVGSLTKAVLRFANQEHPAILSGHFEIVSLTGVMSTTGSHYHISIADETGKTIGAHLLEGCLIYTTAEIVIAELTDHTFLREFDPHTGYPELVIKKIKE